MGVIYKIDDGHCQMTVAEEFDTLGRDVFSLTLSDGGGFSSLWIDREHLLQLRDELNKLEEHS